MKRTISILSTAVLAFGLLAPSIYAANPTPTPSGSGQGDEKGGERHPAIRAAIQALQRAKEDMQHADHDFGGHRVEALRACDEAINQLRQALQYDKK